MGIKLALVMIFVLLVFIVIPISLLTVARSGFQLYRLITNRLHDMTEQTMKQKQALLATTVL